ncbi:hypothetical protein KSP39_PZI008585 [Platanthera zijinensis]|uniref:Uncharacterized protein n=1 Tax=Platanthera zijinensis TaxID=2320716 RepID=A0AAP0G8R1_9ASPA
MLDFNKSFSGFYLSFTLSLSLPLPLSLLLSLSVHLLFPLFLIFVVFRRPSVAGVVPYNLALSFLSSPSDGRAYKIEGYPAFLSRSAEHITDGQGGHHTTNYRSA